MFRAALSYLRHGLAVGRRRIVILLYHRVLPDIKFDPFNSTITVRTFTRQIDYLTKKYQVVPLSEAINKHKSDVANLVLTFDDGYRDNYEIVFPILKRKGLSATFFPVTDYIGSGRVLWDCAVVKILCNYKKIRSIKIDGGVVSQKNMQPRRFFILEVINKMKHLDRGAREKTLVLLKEEAGRGAGYDFLNDKCVSWEQLRIMCAGGMEVGAHSLNHLSLAKIPFAAAMQEIIKSKEAIEENLKIRCLHFAFPFGSRGDFNKELIDCVKSSGFKSCLSNIQGYNYIKKEGFLFKRIIMEENTKLRYLI